MSFGQLGAIIIREQVSSGDGNLEIMIPGHKIQVILMAVKLNQFVDFSDILKTNLNEFLNKITNILHQCAFMWDGWANKTDGEKFLLSWRLPEAEQTTDIEKNDQIME
jgi:hypothetical protein